MCERISSARNSILAAVKKGYYVPRLRKDFSKKKTVSQLNELLGVRRLRWTLEGKNYKSVDLVFYLWRRLLTDVQSGYKTPPTNVHVFYLLLMITLRKGGEKGV